MDYKKIYEAIIERGRNRILAEGVYSECHHIIPRCMCGTDDKANLVKLLPEEHYVCHQLLVKIYFDTEFKHKLAFAAQCMTISNGNQQRNLSKLKWFGWLKKQYVEAITGRKMSVAAKVKMSNAKKGKPSPHKGKKQSAEIVAAKSVRMSGKKKTGDALVKAQAVGKANAWRMSTPQANAKSALARKGKPNAKVAAANTGKPSGMLGKSQSQATKDKISAVKKARNAFRRDVKEQENLLKTVAF
jgi:NUMOD3 motif